MAKQRYQTTLALPSVPIAMPSNIACKEMAKTTINPRKAALKMRKVIKVLMIQFSVRLTVVLNSNLKEFRKKKNTNYYLLGNYQE